MAAVLQILLLYLLQLSRAAIVIPRPQGQYGVGMTEYELTDTSRLDEFATESANRSVVVSIFHPVVPKAECHWTLQRYMPSKTAAYADQDVADLGVPKGTFESFRLQECSKKQSHHTPEGCPESQFRVVLFSPASGASRLYYSAMAQAVASHGYVVVTIDHPYDAHIVEFPDGRVIKSTFDQPGPSLAKQLLDVRVEDVAFVIDSLSGGILNELLSELQLLGTVEAQRVAIYGHSAGGVAALLSMVNEPRIAGGLNMDGGTQGFLKSVIENGVGGPIMLFQAEPQPDWPRLWRHLMDWRLWLKLKNSAHGTFTDVPLLAQLLGVDPSQDPAIAEIIGSIPGGRAMDIITTYVVSFLDFAFGNPSHPLLDGPSKAYPEVKLVRSHE